MRKFLILLLLIFMPLVAGAQQISAEDAEEIEVVMDYLDAAFNVTPVADLAEFHSACYFCPLIVMLSEQISFVFNVIFRWFQGAVILFLFVFFAFSFLSVFAGRFKNMPFELGDFSTYIKDMGGKTKAVLIAAVIAVVPPQQILRFTFEPIMLLSFAVSEQVLGYVAPPGEGEVRCDRRTVVEEINARRRRTQEARPIPPLARQHVERNERALEVREEIAERRRGHRYNPILSEDVVGGAVCLISNMISANSGQLVIGQVLVTNSWNVIEFGFLGAFIVLIMGAMVFGLFFIMNLFIVFYVLDAMIDILELAFLWPFMVVGYAFDVAKFKMSEVTAVAIRFGSTIVSLSVFTMFAALLIGGFMFTVGERRMTSQDILNEAILAGDHALILEAFPGDLVGVSQFLFIAFAIFFTYANLDRFAKSFGAEVSKDHLRSVAKTTTTSVMNYFIRGVTQAGNTFVKKPAKKRGSSAGEGTT